MRIGIIGAGNVGGALGKGWARTGHSIIYGVPDPAEAKYRRVAEEAGGARLASPVATAGDADALVLAIPFEAVNEAVAALGDRQICDGPVVVERVARARFGAHLRRPGSRHPPRVAAAQAHGHISNASGKGLAETDGPRAGPGSRSIVQPAEKEILS